MYFGLRSHNHGPLGLDDVYQYVVPEQYRQQLKSVGVMGGISMGVGACSKPRDKSSRLFLFLVVPSRFRCPDLFRSPVQHRRCYGAYRRCKERHAWVISPHLARPCWPLREPARATRVLRIVRYQTVLHVENWKCEAKTRETFLPED